MSGDFYFITDVRCGGMGVVIITHGVNNNHRVAFKTWAGDVQVLAEAFHREAETWVSLGAHENVVRALAVKKLDDRIYIALEFIPSHPYYGTSLQDWIQRGGLDQALALEFAIQVCRGLEHAAQRSNGTFVHRDLKPANILVHPDGVVKVTDFGISRAVPRYAKLQTSRGRGRNAAQTRAAGTPTTMSPEQWTEGASLDARSDIYSFGCVLFEMFARRPVFVESSLEDFERSHTSTDPPRLSQFAASAPTQLTEIVARCLRKRPSDRYSSFRDVRMELESIQRKLGVNTAVASSAHLADSDELAGRSHDLLVLGRVTEALEAAEEAIRLNPHHATSFVNRGAARGKLGNRSGEIEDYANAIRLDPRNYVAYRNRARAYLQRGEIRAASEDWAAAEKILPTKDDPSGGPRDKATALENLGVARLANREFRKAEATFDDAIALAPDVHSLFAWRGWVRNELGNHDGALSDFDRVITSNPEEPWTRWLRARAHNGAGNFEAAEMDASKAIALESHWAQPYVERAAARFGLLRFRECVADCTEALRRNPRLGTAYLNRANALLELDQVADAHEDFRRALDHELPPVLVLIAEVGLTLTSSPES